MNTIKEWLQNYDNKEEVKSVEMGGIVVRYELAIQELAIEIMRNLSEKEVPENMNDFKSLIQSVTDMSVDKLDKEHGFSGAQVGAAQNIAAVFFRKTPAGGLKQMEEIDPERILILKKNENDKCELINSKLPENI